MSAQEFSSKARSRARKFKAPVTIIIGIKCLNGIVLTCDSRTTKQSGYIDDSTLKLDIVTFQDGNNGIVARAGNDAQSAIAVEYMQNLAKRTALNDYRAMAVCAETAIGQMRRQMSDYGVGDSESIKRTMDEQHFELMIAHYYNDEPHLFTIGVTDVLARKIKLQYCAIGCGHVLADFLISRLDLSQFGTAHGIWTAVYAVEEIKKFDGRCGGATRAAIVTNENGLSKADLCIDDPLQEAIQEALDFSEISKEMWTQIADTRIRAVIGKRMPKNAS